MKSDERNQVNLYFRYLDIFGGVIVGILFAVLLKFTAWDSLGFNLAIFVFMMLIYWSLRKRAKELRIGL